MVILGFLFTRSCCLVVLIDFNIHKAVECIHIKFIILVFSFKINKRHWWPSLIKMSDDSSDQIQDNEFIKNFSKNFITRPKNIQKFNKILNNDTKISHEDIQRIKLDDQTMSPKEILEISRSRAVNSHSMKSFNTQSQNDQSQKISSLQKLKAKKQKEQKIFTNRFSQYKQKLSKSILKLESICEQNFGGLQYNNRQLNIHQLSKQELVEYYAKMLPKNTDLPKIIQKYKDSKKQSQKLPKIRSFSQKNIQFMNSHVQKKIKKQLQLNKWYIEPHKRFSVKNDKKLYDWKTEEGVRNVIRTQQLKIKSRQIHNLIKEVREKLNRQPIFCKYLKIV